MLYVEKFLKLKLFYEANTTATLIIKNKPQCYIENRAVRLRAQQQPVIFNKINNLLDPLFSARPCLSRQMR
jgi:hypothetical protein